MPAFEQTSSGIWAPPASALGFNNKKADPPKLGEAFGAGWTGPTRGRHQQIMAMPGGGMIAFDLSRLTLNDYRGMRDHYQINASLSVLSFMLHQMEWSIECSDKKIAEFCTENIQQIWPQLVRAMSQSFWAGYSPNVLQWENDANSRTVQLTKIKDLIPERCAVNWKQVNGYSPPGSNVTPKINVFNGIKEIGSVYPIPTDNSLWYPILMENGDYYGRKLLKPAFTSWFFSTLMHLFANRYYERFGEPTPVGRAPYDDTVTIGTGESAKSVQGNVLMEQIIGQLRNRSIVVLPNEKSGGGATGQGAEYDYTLEYLESQMRGADFERYMTRLDEEMSLALFMPLLLMRTADVGSYNLGVTHFQLWLWILNAITSDWKMYIDPYILGPMVDTNFSPNAPRATLKYQKLGKMDAETMRVLLQALVQSEGVMPDLDELGQMAGMTLKQVKQVTKPPADPTDPADPADPADPKNLSEVRATGRAIIERITGQINKAFRDHTFGEEFNLMPGYKRKFTDALCEADFESPETVADTFYGRMEWFSREIIDVGEDLYSGPEAVMAILRRYIEGEIEELAKA